MIAARNTDGDLLDDPVRMYLRQMGQVPLLSREEEVAISKRIEAAEFDVFQQRISLSKAEKIRVTAQTWFTSMLPSSPW